jgi:hypothetical protein
MVVRWPRRVEAINGRRRFLMITRHAEKMALLTVENAAGSCL